MATMREVDTAMWLHNKLSSDDMWSGTNIWSLLTADILRNIQDCFHTLDSQVKIKLLMSFLYIPRRNAQEMGAELNDILEIGSSDSDDWVRILSEILRNYPETGSLNTDLENVSPVFAAIVQDIRQTMSDSKNRRSLLPMECPYLNRGALLATIGAQPAPAKHFTLRRKPKSAALKAELFQKATDSSSSLKRSHSLHAGSSGGLKRSDSTGKSPVKPNVPLARVHSKTAPSAGTSALRGISAASLKQQNRTAKLLDINEQPIGGGVREAKRRKKMITAEMEHLIEEDRKKKELAKAQETATPEYALGPGLTTPAETPQPVASTAQTTTTTPSYASMAGMNTHPHLLSSTKTDSTSQQDNSLTASSANFSQELQMHIERERENMKRRQNAAPAPQPNTTHPSTSFKSVSLQPPSQPSVPARRPTLPNQPVTPNPAPKRDLKLTREQMIAAQEMFRDANKVTKPEKALILGFMAGARENPFPDQGPVITVKLSEHTEISTAPSMNTPQTQLVEMLFEMNYDTGHWRRLKRTRVVARQQQPAEPSAQ